MRRSIERLAQRHGATLVQDAGQWILTAPLDHAWPNSGERRLYAWTLADLWERCRGSVPYHMAPELADALADFGPERETDPVTAGIVADWLDDHAADEAIIEQYAGIVYDLTD